MPSRGSSSGPRTLDAAFNSNLWESAPPLIGLIPPGASVWADEYLSVWLGARTQLKPLHFSALPTRFDSLLFRPEYVLLNKVFAIGLAPPTNRERVLGFLSREGYAKIGESGNLALLKDPQAPRPGPSPALELPPRADDRERVQPYAAALLDSTETRTRLSAYPADLRFVPQTVEESAAFGSALSRRGLPGLAIEYYRAALAARPDYVEAHNNLATALAGSGDLRGAEEHLREALRLRPKQRLAGYNLGNVLIQEKEPADAAAVLEEALRVNPADGRIANSLGAAYMLQGRRDDARRTFERALALDPSLTDARENLKALRRP